MKNPFKVEQTEEMTAEEIDWREKERERDRNYVKQCLNGIEQPLTLKGLEEFFKRYNSPTNSEESAQYTAELLADLKRDFTSEDLQKRTPSNNAFGFITEAEMIVERVSDYKWRKSYSWDYQDFAGDRHWRKDILERFNQSIEKQEKEQAKENVEAKTEKLGSNSLKSILGKSEVDVSNKNNTYAQLAINRKNGNGL